MAKATVAIRVDVDTYNQLTEIAQERNCSRMKVIEDLLSNVTTKVDTKQEVTNQIKRVKPVERVELNRLKKKQLKKK